MRPTLATMVLAGLLGGACGGGDPEATADAFADGACAAFADFGDVLLPAFSEGPAAKVFSGEFVPKSLDEVKETFTALGDVFDTYNGALEDLVDDLDALDVGGVEGGEAFRDRLVENLDKAKALTEQAGKQLKETKVDSVEDIAAQGPAIQKFGEAFSEIDLDFAATAPAGLREAFQRSEPCKEAGKRFAGD